MTSDFIDKMTAREEEEILRRVMERLKTEDHQFKSLSVDEDGEVLEEREWSDEE